MKTRKKIGQPPAPGARQRAVLPWREVLVRQAREQVKRFRRARRLAAAEGAEEAVHRLRVGARRLLAHVALTETWLPTATARGARRALKKYLRTTSTLRDWQVQLHWIDTLLRRHPELAPFRRNVQRRADRAAQAMTKKLTRGRPAQRIGRWERELRAAANLPGHPGRADRAAARRRLLRTFTRILGVQRGALSDPDRKHDVRVALKSYRYLAEALQSLLPEITEDRLVRLHDCQSRMGEVHDLMLLEARLAKFAAHRASGLRLDACRRELAQRRVALERGQRRITANAHGCQ